MRRVKISKINNVGVFTLRPIGNKMGKKTKICKLIFFLYFNFRARINYLNKNTSLTICIQDK